MSAKLKVICEGYLTLGSHPLFKSKRWLSFYDNPTVNSNLKIHLHNRKTQIHLELRFFFF